MTTTPTGRTSIEIYPEDLARFQQRRDRLREVRGGRWGQKDGFRWLLDLAEDMDPQPETETQP